MTWCCCTWENSQRFRKRWLSSLRSSFMTEQTNLDHCLETTSSVRKSQIQLWLSRSYDSHQLSVTSSDSDRESQIQHRLWPRVRFSSVSQSWIWLSVRVRAGEHFGSWLKHETLIAIMSCLPLELITNEESERAVLVTCFHQGFYLEAQQLILQRWCWWSSVSLLLCLCPRCPRLSVCLHIALTTASRPRAKSSEYVFYDHVGPASASILPSGVVMVGAGQVSLVK